MTEKDSDGTDRVTSPNLMASQHMLSFGRLSSFLKAQTATMTNDLGTNGTATEPEKAPLNHVEGEDDNEDVEDDGVAEVPGAGGQQILRLNQSLITRCAYLHR